MRLIGIIILIISLNSCIGAGTHGSIKTYEYPVPKAILQSAIETVMANGGNIYRDTTLNYIIDQTDGRNDTIYDNYYNDGEGYVTIYICFEGGVINISSVMLEQKVIGILQKIPIFLLHMLMMRMGKVGVKA